VVFAWELGANFGHLSRQLGPAMELRRRGHEVIFVACDTLSASRLLSDHGFPFVQAPTIRRSAVRSERRTTLNYSSLLAAYGYLEAGVLRALLQAWRHQFQQLKPDVVVIDHSPTALLAVRTLAIPAVQIGTSFFMPPPADPLPSLQPWLAVPVAELAKTDEAVLKPINAVLQSFGSPRLPHLGRLFAEAPAMLTTFPELDHYGARTDLTYVGPISAATQYPVVEWAANRGRRIFAYLRQSTPGIEAVLNVLRTHSGQVICSFPDAPPAMRERLAQSGVQVHNQPVDLRSALNGCDVVVNYAGMGTVAQALLAGVPQLLLPEELEQGLTARRAARVGAAILERGKTQQDLQTSLDRLLEEPQFAAAAREFASRHADFNNAAAIEHVVSGILAAAGSAAHVAAQS
jgi:UDP:flavonoid glycosyltransferase YjiC (YdhE family)